MQVKDYNNLTAIIIGVSIVILCFLMTFLCQKYIFKKYAKKTKSILNKNDDKSVP